MKTIKVAAAVIRDGSRIFATQRGYGPQKGGWEFPGGKIEKGESPEEALDREIREELETEIKVGKHIDTVEYDYPEFHLSMECFWCEIIRGDLVLKEHEAAKWLDADSIDSVSWLPADILLVNKIKDQLRMEVVEKSIYSAEVQEIIGELNQFLIDLTGQNGTRHFSPEDVSKPGSCFLLAYLDGIPWGCGGLRKINNNTAEIKRIYARKNTVGVGRKIMETLEEKARNFGYTKLVLSARIENLHALEFYENIGYSRCEKFEPYTDNPYLFCYEKMLRQI